MSRADRQLQAARRLLAHLGSLLDSELAVRLWNGELVALGSRPPGGMALAIRRPGAVTRLLRRPRLETAIELFARGDLDLEGGTLLDFAAHRGKLSTKDLRRRLDKRLLLKSLLPFLLETTAAQGKTHAFEGGGARRRDDRALIEFHYDLSNDFYRLFLDSEMQYSCAYFPDWQAPLEAAQEAKLEHICRKLRLKPGERFLDVGCGWGGLVCHAAGTYGVQATGVTLSEAQLAEAEAKVRRLGLEDRVSLKLLDVRDLTGSFDKIASVGMFEHLGLAHHAAYFAKLHGLLRPRGLLLQHAIARPAKRSLRRFRKKRAEYRALTRYIFPGGELDYIGLTLTNLERHGFEVHDVEGLREHYARTCRLWCERLAARRGEAEALVGPAKTRLWLLYLAGCALAFERSGVGIFQTLASRRDKGPSGLPPTRADLYR